MTLKGGLQSEVFGDTRGRIAVGGMVNSRETCCWGTLVILEEIRSWRVNLVKM